MAAATRRSSSIRAPACCTAAPKRAKMAARLAISAHFHERHPMLRIFTIIVLLVACTQARAERLVLASASYGKNIVAICDADGTVLWSHKTAGPKTGHAGHHD